MISVLLVDDEVALLDVTKRFLEKGKDIIVTATASAYDALTLMESHRFHAVVSDYEMPLMNGLDFLRSVKSRGDDTPFIIFTGRGREYVAIEALNSGATFYLQKGGDITAQYAELRNMVYQAVQRKQSEHALLNREERYRAVVESQMELICRFQPDGTYLFVNGAYCRYYGRTIDELVGHRDSPKIFPEDQVLINRHFSSLTPENPTGSMEHRINCPQSGTRWQQWSDTAIFNERGDVTEYQSVGRDITEKKQTEDELKNTLSLIEATLESTDNGILVVGGEGQIIKTNKRFAEMWHIPGDILASGKDEALLDYILDQLSDSDAFVNKVRELYNDPDAKSFDLIYFKDGRIFERTSKPMLVADISKGRVWSFLDVTERKRVEVSLQQANRKLHLLSSVTRHDINNQLMVLNGYIELLKEMQPDPSFNEYFQNVTEAGERISAMIQFTKEYEDIGVTTPAWQDIRTLVTTVSMETPHGQVMVENDIPAGTEVFADPLFGKAFHNLIDNAVRHGGGISKITFSTQKLNGNLLIFCEDDGSGVSVKEKELIFRLGYGKHTGFGLYLIREILSITGIALDEIGEPGKGALFRMSVPMNGSRDVQEPTA